MRVSVKMMIVGASLLVAPGCGGSAPSPATGPSPGAAGAAARVTAGPPERGAIRRVTEEPGRVEPFETAPIHAKLAGYVKSVGVDIGDAVKQGQVLAELDVPEVEAEAERSRAGVARAQADAATAEAAVAVAASALEAAEARRVEADATTRRTAADLARWTAEFNRIERLLRESAITESLRDETRGKLDSARAAAEEADARVKSAAAAVGEARAAVTKAKADAASARAAVDVATAEARRAEALLDYRALRAPFDGVVIARDVDTGHLTVPGGSADPLFVVARLDRVTVVVDVPEADAALVNAGDPARLRFPAQGGRTVEAKVTRTSASLDATARTLRVEIDLPGVGDGQSGPIRPGQYAYATITADERSDALTVPAAAVVRDGGKTFCVVVEAEKARRRPVVLGLGDGTRFEVVEGLSPTDVVVLANAEGLADGQALRPSPPEKSAAPAAKK